jgi:hypothetical protein
MRRRLLIVSGQPLGAGTPVAGIEWVTLLPQKNRGHDNRGSKSSKVNQVAQEVPSGARQRKNVWRDVTQHTVAENEMSIHTLSVVDDVHARDVRIHMSLAPMVDRRTLARGR